MGLEPTTFELEVQSADPLGHEGTTVGTVLLLSGRDFSKNMLLK